LTKPTTTPIRRCTIGDFQIIYAVINEAAEAYRGVIPPDCWKDPYMSRDELQHEIEAGVDFWGYENEQELVGVMGIQEVKDVTLIRHAYVRPTKRNHGIGGALLAALCQKTNRPILVGTWAAATWAIRFYQRRGFQLVPDREKDELLRKYWAIPQRQIETSVVLADRKWLQGGR